MSEPSGSEAAEGPVAKPGATRCGLPADKPTLAEMVAEARAHPGSLRVCPRGDVELLLARAFPAPSVALFAAWTTPDLLKAWLMPPPMPLRVAALDLRPGGAYRFEAGAAESGLMAWGGTYLQVDAPHGFRATERFDTAWYPGEAQVAVAFHEGDSGTVATLTLAYESLKARDTVLRSPMDAGLAESFSRLERLVAPR